jgi:hypothetical protein
MSDPFAAVFDGDAGDEGGGFAGGVLDADGDDVVATGEVARDVILVELLGGFACADAAAVEIDLVLVVSRDGDLAAFGDAHVKRLAEMASFAGGDGFLGVLGRPDPLGFVGRGASRES